MTNHRPQPIDEERRFLLEELFFSTTDARGLISHGNEVFVRVSGYSETELIGAPHNLIRHPDMPRAVFKLFWDYIAAGRTIAAYVKNLAKDGRYYWVLALAMPCPGGYLSVRLKPSSPLLEAVQQIYQQALAVERQVEVDSSCRKASIAAGLQSLTEQLQAAGFDSYDQFMQAALSRELCSRREQLGSRAPQGGGRLATECDPFELPVGDHCRRIHAQLSSMFSSLEQLKLLRRDFIASADNLEQTSSMIQNASLNATISSQSLGEGGRVLAEIARLLRDSAGDTIRAIGALSESMEVVSQRLNNLAFDVAVTELQVEVCTFFAAELQVRGSSPEAGGEIRADATASLGILLDQLSVRTGVAYSATAEMRRQLGAIRAPIERLSRLFSEMRMIQFAGRKEAMTHSQGQDFAIVFEDVALRVKASTSDCSGLMESITRCELMLADAAQGERAVAKDLCDARAWAAGREPVRGETGLNGGPAIKTSGARGATPPGWRGAPPASQTRNARALRHSTR